MTIKELYDYGRKKISHEAVILLEELYGFSRQNIILNPNREIENSKVFLDAIERRINGEPLQYILGYWYFDDMKLKVKDGVLIPREDSLVLVECAEKYIQNKSLTGVDLCSGTGAIALGITQRCQNSNIYAIELFDVPFECLCDNINTFNKDRVNAKNLDIFTSHDSFSNLDFIVSNPPYIETQEIGTLDIEVKNEPHTALDGGSDGLDFYKHICKNWKKSLKIGGFLAVEIGDTQAEDVSMLFKTNGFVNVTVVKDFNNLDRVVFGYNEICL